jgi:L-ascorbate metabolism protein UlaG (beta-lactamase superfamily)
VVVIELIGGPTALIELGGLRLLTDPTFDPPGDHVVGGRTLTKLCGPSTSIEQLQPIDVVLLSHDQHPDNLDRRGRELLQRVPLVLTTAEAAERLGGTARALPRWRHVVVDRPNGGPLRVIGVPAVHGPDGMQNITGNVTGFVMAGEDLPTVYVSGDNASLDVVASVAHHCGPIDVALLFGGAARTTLLDAYLTLTSRQLAEAAQLLGASLVIPLHVDGWRHITEGPEQIASAFAERGEQTRLVRLTPGQSVSINHGAISSTDSLTAQRRTT